MNTFRLRYIITCLLGLLLISTGMLTNSHDISSVLWIVLGMMMYVVSYALFEIDDTFKIEEKLFNLF